MSKETPKISTVIPYYKAEKFINEAVQSVINQSLGVSEIIIVNDECTDHSRDVLKTVEESCDLVKVIQLERNSGAANARNIGVAQSHGEYIAFLDADDRWTQDKLTKQFELLENDKDLVGSHTGTAVFNGDNIIATYCDKPIRLTLSEMPKSSHVTPSSLLLRKSVFEQLGGYDTSFAICEDYDFNIRLVKNGYLLGFVPEALTMVRREGYVSLSSNGVDNIKNKLKLLSKHYSTFGLKGSFVFASRAFLSAGGKVGGIKGKLLRGIGLLLYPPNINEK